jgi:DNA-binding NarL/FixJ family response regulator
MSTKGGTNMILFTGAEAFGIRVPEDRTEQPVSANLAVQPSLQRDRQYETQVRNHAGPLTGHSHQANDSVFIRSSRMFAETRIIIADSLEIVRTSLAQSISDLDQNFVVVQAESGSQVVEECEKAPVDIVLLDLSLKLPSATETLRHVRQNFPKTKVMVQYLVEHRREALHAIALGANGAISRSAKARDFQLAVMALSANFTLVPQDLTPGLMGMHPAKARSGNSYGLTQREIEVMSAGARHGSSRRISETLSISPRTVEAHRSAIYRKTGCRSLAELSELAKQLGDQGTK